MVNIIVAPMKKLVLMRNVVVALVSEMTRSCSDSDFSENTTITVLPGWLPIRNIWKIYKNNVQNSPLLQPLLIDTNLTVLQRGAEPGLST